MNKTDRMLAIILELQRHTKRRAGDLAETFETCVRTIYRDIQALSEAGVPIIGSPGHGYSLIEGYFLPPVSITADEAVTLLLGLEFIDQQFDDSYQACAGSVRKKIEAVLTDKVRKEASQTRAGLRLNTSASGKKLLSGNMSIIRQAVSENRQLCFQYFKKTIEPGEQPSVRCVNPYGLLFRNGIWTLIAYCHLRQDLRHFQLKRMREVELTMRTFDPPDFDLQSYNPPDQREAVVRIQVSPQLAPQVAEYEYFYVEQSETDSEGLILTLRVHQPEDVLQWVLSWGSGVVVLEPDSLRSRVKQEIVQMMNRY